MVGTFSAIVQMAQGPFSSNYSRTAQPSISTPNNTKLDPLIDLARHLCESTAATTEVNEILTIMSDNDAFTDLDIVLSNHEIQQFLRTTTSIENLPNYCTIVGYIATKLIQNTHHDGINEFTFDMHGIKPISQFGESLEKEVRKKLDLMIYGELGIDAFYRATCNAIVESASGIFAQDAFGEFSVWKLYDPGYTKQSNTPFWTRYISSEYYKVSQYSQHSIAKKYRYTRQAEYNFRTIYDVSIPSAGTAINYYSTRSAIKFFESLGITQDPMIELTRSDFKDKWKPAVKPFATMKKLYGGRQ